MCVRLCLDECVHECMEPWSHQNVLLGSRLCLLNDWRGGSGALMTWTGCFKNHPWRIQLTFEQP